MNDNAWVTCPQPNPQARFRLLCFPYAGGKASIFRTWSDGLLPDIEVCPLQLPGRGNRLKDPPFTQLPYLIQAMVPALLPRLDIPFALFGHSMGALISFELARHLRREYSLSPVHLFVSGRQAPQLPPLYAPLHPLPDPEFMAALHRLRGTPEPVLQNADMMQLLLPLLRADFTLSETYVYTSEAPLDCSISAFGGIQDELVNYDGLAAWRDQTWGIFKLHLMPGNHFFLNDARELIWSAILEDLIQFS